MGPARCLQDAHTSHIGGIDLHPSTAGRVPSPGSVVQLSEKSELNTYKLQSPSTQSEPQVTVTEPQGCPTALPTFTALECEVGQSLFTGFMARRAFTWVRYRVLLTHQAGPGSRAHLYQRGSRHTNTQLPSKEYTDMSCKAWTKLWCDKPHQ